MPSWLGEELERGSPDYFKAVVLLIQGAETKGDVEEILTRLWADALQYQIPDRKFSHKMDYIQSRGIYTEVRPSGPQLWTAVPKKLWRNLLLEAHYGARVYWMLERTGFAWKVSVHGVPGSRGRLIL